MLFTDYAYPFEIASVILLVAIIAAVMLTLRRRKDTRTMQASAQIAVKAKDHIIRVNAGSEVEESVPAAKQGEQS